MRRPAVGDTVCVYFKVPGFRNWRTSIFDAEVIAVTRRRIKVRFFHDRIEYKRYYHPENVSILEDDDE